MVEATVFSLFNKRLSVNTVQHLSSGEFTMPKYATFDNFDSHRIRVRTVQCSQYSFLQVYIDLLSTQKIAFRLFNI